MNEIELWSGTTKALVSLQGGWLTNLSDEYGDVLYPKRTLVAGDGRKKERGGSHVCLPNFGPGGSSGQLQHGFGRVSSWDIADQAESHVTLLLPAGQGEYEPLRSTLRYALNGQSCSMTLTVANAGSVPLRIAPAFHPYLMAGSAGSLAVDDVVYKTDELAEMQLVDHVQKIKLGRRTFTVSTEGLSRWALWTDQLGQYVCVEPTMDGYAFMSDEPQPTELLRPGEQRMFSYCLAWS